MSEKSIGAVKWFDNSKGYGFIVNEAGEDVFVHHRSIMGQGYKTLFEGEQVEYIQTRSEKGWQAAEVVREADRSVEHEEYEEYDEAASA